MSRGRKRRGLTPEEARLWGLVVREAVPLKGAQAFVPPEDPPPSSDPTPAPLARPAALLAAPTPPAPKRSLPGLKPGATAGVDKRTAQRFTRGRMEIEARIDLHGMTQEAAHGALVRFIESSAYSGRRCVLVITGKGAKGEGVLRQKVPFWLNDARLRPLILSFSQAQIHHGGGGALYVLLKRNRA